MGGAKSITHMYTYNEYLYYYINKRDIPHVEEVLQKKPELISDPITPTSKVTALIQTASTNNLELAQILITKYSADPNLPSQKGETPLIAAIRKNHLEMVKFLIEKGADPHYVDAAGFSTIEYSILQGLYEICFLIYSKLQVKDLKSPEQYSEMGKKYQYRYVNYKMLLEELENNAEPEKARDFLKKERVVLTDPVIDPRQTWGQWVCRNVQFKNPPLIERSELPEELRPENRRFGKISHFFGKMALTPASQKPSYKKETQSEFEVGSNNNVLNERDDDAKTVS